MRKCYLRKYLIIILLICLATMPMETIEAVNIEKLDYLLGLPIGEIHNEKIYQRFAKGQCTWYAWGRFREVHHKRIRFKAKAGLSLLKDQTYSFINFIFFYLVYQQTT